MESDYSKVLRNGKSVDTVGSTPEKVFEKLKDELKPCESITLYNRYGFKIDAFHTFKNISQVKPCGPKF